MIKSIIVSVAMVFASGTALAGNLDAPAAPTDPGSAMYTGEDIYTLLTTGAKGTPRSGAFTEPSAGPAGGGHTLTDIMNAAPAADGNGAAVSDVLSGRTFWGLMPGAGAWGTKTGTMVNNGAVTINPGKVAQPVAAGYHNGSGTVTGDANLVAENIKSGAAIFGVNGSVIQATGNAAAGNVLTGTTFSNATAAGLAGAMPNNGAVNITPGATSQPIPAGYHNGLGTVAGDANLVAGNIMSGTVIFGVTGTLPPSALPHAGVNKTGQTQCWNKNTFDPVSCADPSATGEDGAYQYGIFPALPPTGGYNGAYNTPALVRGVRFFDIGDGTVIDNITGLIWLKNASCTDTVGGIAGGSLSWADALTWSNALASGKCNLTDNSTAGQWRLPNINELNSLGPAWPPGAPFTGVQSPWYWSSSTYADRTDCAWVVLMSDGSVLYGNKTNHIFAWPVRGGK